MRRRFAFAVFILGSAAFIGCGSSVLGGSELSVSGSGWYYLGMLLVTPATGCLALASTTSFFLDGAPLPSSPACGAVSEPLLEDRTFAVGVRVGDETGQIVVSDMFPGLHAVVSDPPGGRVAPGGDLVIPIPPAAQVAWPYLAHFRYNDADDPSYTGETAYPTSMSAAAVVRAPTHPGHFTLWIQMNYQDASVVTAGRIVSCSGVAKCSAVAAADLGPMDIEVAP